MNVDMPTRSKASKRSILSFCIGSYDGTALFFEDVEPFLRVLQEKIEEAEAKGAEHFDITIEYPEC